MESYLEILPLSFSKKTFLLYSTNTKTTAKKLSMFRSTHTQTPDISYLKKIWLTFFHPVLNELKWIHAIFVKYETVFNCLSKYVLYFDHVNSSRKCFEVFFKSKTEQFEHMGSKIKK